MREKAEINNLEPIRGLKEDNKHPQEAQNSSIDGNNKDKVFQLKDLKNIYFLTKNIDALAYKKQEFIKNDNSARKANAEKANLNMLKKKSTIKATEPNNQIVNNVNTNKMELMKIDAIENKSKRLKQIIEIQKNSKSYKIKKFFEKVLEGNIYIVVMMIMNTFILFISDIQNGWLPHDCDRPIELIQTIIFSIYCLEIIITSLCKDTYVNSFFFWLDILSTIYIIQDISFILYPIAGINTDYL